MNNPSERPAVIGGVMADHVRIADISPLSLLYPDAGSENNSGTGGLSRDTWEQLEGDVLLDLRGCDPGDFFSDDGDVIAYRQEVFRDLTANPELCRAFSKMIPLLDDISELRRMGSDVGGSAESYLFSITEIEIYVSVISLLHDSLAAVKDSLESRALRELTRRIESITESDYYRDINEKLKELTSRVGEVRSVTVGVNLDAQLKATSAGVLSVNNEPFKSGELIDRILRLDFKSDERTCIAPLTPFDKSQSENRQLAMSTALYSALTDVFRSSVKAWRRIVKEYVLENTDFLLELLPEIELLTKGTELILSLSEKGAVMTYPQTVSKEGELVFDAKGIYNPIVTVKLGGDVVKNDFCFDKEGTLYVLTGPNRGGKSVITCAVGLAFAMTGLGLPVCADEMKISPCSGIFTHFPSGGEDTIDKGRLGEECSRLERILDAADRRSLVLLDESLSSTGSYEGAIIASEVLSGLSVIGCRTIFSTHLHDLAASVGSINEKCAPLGGARVDNLVAEVGAGGERSFRIKREAPDGKSYARDISEKYGLSFDGIVKKINERRGR